MDGRDKPGHDSPSLLPCEAKQSRGLPQRQPASSPGLLRRCAPRGGGIGSRSGGKTACLGQWSMQRHGYRGDAVDEGVSGAAGLVERGEALLQAAAARAGEDHSAEQGCDGEERQRRVPGQQASDHAEEHEAAEPGGSAGDDDELAGALGGGGVQLHLILEAGDLVARRGEAHGGAWVAGMSKPSHRRSPARRQRAHRHLRRGPSRK
ncbi:hypothetical protein SLNSH_02565 [Alsobacter soli]|uniref:Uncharacterized protein n=1 Tax=Alsobacter soli TaxID=2109933 RepID=A0A2T1HYN0_9HYPH|nr:hypothetical protein SLNSH_02565 [Alsobacter soli]